MAKSAAGTYVFNERKMLDASHVVVFCAKTAMDDARWSALSIRKKPMVALIPRKRKRQTIRAVPTLPTCTAWI